MTGQVIDENKEPMIGVSILIVGTSTGTVTDFDGNYTLNVPQGSKELQFSYVGYETKVVPVPANSTTLNVQLKSDSQVLSDVVVIGSSAARSSLASAKDSIVTNVSSKDFNMGLVSSPEQLINGKISGVQIMSNSGSPTAGSTIRVRGGASLNASNDPLIVLDGVPLEQGGISGKDGRLLTVKKKLSEGQDIGYVGEVTHVNEDILLELLEDDFLPIVCHYPILEDQLYNR